MRVQILLIVSIIAILLVGCSTQTMPYKSLADARLSSPTGNVVGVQKEAPKTETVTTQQSEPAAQQGPSCRDSDHGKFTTAFGKVTGIDDSGDAYEIADTCVGSLLYEYDCNGAKPVVSKEKCKRGCQNGFCI